MSAFLANGPPGNHPNHAATVVIVIALIAVGLFMIVTLYRRGR